MIDHKYVADAPEKKRIIMAPSSVVAPFDSAVLELV